MADARLNDRSAASLECRDFNHSWRFLSDEVTEGLSGLPVEFRRTMTCARCGSERREVFEVPSFRVVTRSYSYVDGYLVPGGRVLVADVRRESFERTHRQLLDDAYQR